MPKIDISTIPLDGLEDWRKRQWIQAADLVNAGIIDDFEEAKSVMYDGIMSYISWDDWIDENGEEEEKEDSLCYRIAERIILGKYDTVKYTERFFHNEKIKALKEKIRQVRSSINK